MDTFEKLKIIGNIPFNENHQTFLLKNGKCTLCYVRVLPGNRIEVVTEDGPRSYPSHNILEMSNSEKAELFDIEHNIKTAAFIVYDEEIKVTLDLPHILRECSTYYNLPEEVILKKTRKREIVQTRQIVHYFGMKLTKYSLAIVGAEIGGKDHATVLNSCKVINNLIDTDPKIKNQLHEIERNLRKKYKILVKDGNNNKKG